MLSRCVVMLICVAGCGLAARAEAPAGELKTEHFDSDPQWEGLNNHIQPAKPKIVAQDFGYSATTHAAKSNGELGGRVMRAAKGASYAKTIEPVTLKEKLSASGTFAITDTSAGGGIFFGFFNARQHDGSGRAVGSLGMDFDGEKSGARLAVRLIAADNQACGTFITPFIPGKFRPTPIHNDGTRYHWTLNYDPEGNGRVTYRLTSDNAKPEEFEGKDFTIDLPPGFKEKGTTFDRFGLMSGMKPGGTMKVYFGDLERDGKAENFASDPHWTEAGNRENYEAKDQLGAHDFGFSSATHFAEGEAAGEVGGSFWRSGKYAYYADKVGPLSMENRLEAHGKVILLVGAPDSDMFLGWFGSAHRESPASDGDFVGVHVGGPTRVGHYFSPVFATSNGTTGRVKTAPVLTPGKAFEWSLVYDPKANDGRGEMRVTLGNDSATLELKPGVKATGAKLDRFGLFTSNIGGQLVKIYLDDLKYTAQ